MEMHQVRYFVALADTSNFTRAAEACNVSQPSLTRAIRRLEDEMGAPLFDRHRNGTTLTELGAIMLPHLASIAAQAQSAAECAVAYARSTRTTLRLGVMCTISPAPLLSLIKAVCVGHPEIALKITDFTARQLEGYLLDGDLDVALYAEAGELHDRLHYHPLFREQMMVVVRPDDPFASRPSVACHDLLDRDYINRINCEYNSAAVWGGDDNRWKIAHKSDRDDWVLAMVAAGMGFGFLPSFSVHHPNVASRPLSDPELWREVSIVTVRGRRHSSAVGAFIREAIAVKWEVIGHAARGSVRDARG